MTHKQRVLDLLSDGAPHSHHELYALHVIGHSRIADLRRDGYTIAQWREGDEYMYQLVSPAEPQPLLSSPDENPRIICGSADETQPSLFQIPASARGAYDEAA